ncbi:MAG: hypothetical protein C5B53_10860 [Candidatus Melainabacteria bacterium]|nr:MAG: hypothetical protein C5B53_10860 [Candidatus Melainabacteria bacterium]
MIATSKKSAKSIDLLIGPYRSGKTQALLQRVVQQCLKNPEDGATIVVPSNRYRTLLEERLLHFSRGLAVNQASQFRGFLGLRVLTFYQSCQRILKQYGVLKRIVPDTLRPSLIAHVLSRLKKQGQVNTLDAIAAFPGTPAALLDLVDELERSGNSPQQVLGRLELTAASDSQRFELAKVYQSYWESLDQIGYLDRRRLAYKLLEVLSDRSQQPADSLGFFAFDGFDRLNALQLHVIDAIANHTDTMLFSFDYLEAEDDKEVEYLWKEASFVELKSILGSKLRFIESARSSVEGKANSPVVESFSAPDRYLEMTEVASRIKSAIKIGSKDLNKFLVVARSLEKYRSAVESAFQEAGIDYFMDEPIALTALPLVQFLLKMCSLQLNGFPRADVVRFLRSKYFNLERFAFSERHIDELDHCSREKAVLGGEKQWRSALVDCGRDDLWQSLKKVFDLLTPAKQRGTASAYIHWIEDTIGRLLTLPSEEEFSDPFVQWEQDTALAQFRNVLAQLLNEQEILSRLSHQDETPFADFHSRLERLVERSNFQQQPRTKDYVLICGAELAPNKRFEQVFVAGLTEGEFPRHSRGMGFLNSDEVEKWQRFGVDIQNPRLNPSFESALFKSLIQRAGKRIVFSYPLVEMSGDELTPSSLLREAASLDPERVPFVHAMESMKTRPNSARNAVATQFWQAPSRQLPGVFLGNESITALIDKLAEPLSMAGARNASGIGGPLNGSLVDYVLAGTVVVPIPKYFSPSSLSDYGKCPFRFWMSHILKIKPYEEAEAGLSPLLLGQTYHSALELFYKGLLAEHLSITELSDEKLTALVEEVSKEAVALLNDYPEFHKDEFWDHRYQEIKFRLKRLLKAERTRALERQETFTPRLMEVSFGFEKEGAYPPLKITQGQAEVLIRGRIDRVDIADQGELRGPARVRVVDYKSGSTPASANDVLSGRNLQLPLYILAVENAILPGSQVVEAEYLSVGAATPFGKMEFENARTAHDVKQMISATKTNVVNFATAIKKGEFSVKPSASNVCGSCDHKTVCRIAELNQSQASESGGDNGTN